MSCDIYSFGVICLEMLTSRLAYDDSFDPPSVANAFEEAEEEGTLASLIDTSTSANWSEETAGGLIKLTKDCLKSRGKNRPTIVVVLKCLLTEVAKYSVTSLTSSSSNSQKSEISFCVICLDAPRTHVLAPCGHKCLCGACVTDYQSAGAKCPLCRAPCTGTMRVFD